MSNFQRLGPQLLTVVVLAIWAFSLEMLHTYYLFLMNLKETGQLPQQVVCVLPCFRGRKRRNSKQQLQIFHFLLPYHTGKVMYPYACKNWISLKSYWPSGEKLFKFSFMASKFEFFFFNVCLLVVGWYKSTLGRAICFAQSTNWNASVFWKHLPATPRNNISCDIQASCGPVKFTHKIQHHGHIVLYFSLSWWSGIIHSFVLFWL